MSCWTFHKATAGSIMMMLQLWWYLLREESGSRPENTYDTSLLATFQHTEIGSCLDPHLKCLQAG